MMQLALLAAVFLNIAVARQIIGILYLTFLPGFIILKLLNVGKLDTIERALFSIGFSIAFLMLLGLFINQFGAFAGISEPLSMVTMVGSISSFVLTGELISYFWVAHGSSFSVIGKIELKPLIFLIIPVLSVVGAISVAINGTNSFLLLTVILVSTVLGVSVISSKILPPKYYAIVIFSVALAMVFYSSLATIRLQGFDIHAEYNVVLDTQEEAYWHPSAPIETSFERYGHMLSVTILPTIYSNILDMDAAWILKTVFPLMLAFVPLGVFKLWQTKWGNRTAFIAAFVLMVQTTFYTEMLGLCRQIVAELFLVLLLLIFFGEKMDSRIKNICFIAFGFGLIASHYGIALVFMFIVFGLWLLILVSRKGLGKITLVHVALFFVMMFGWYMFTRSGATVQSIFDFGEFVLAQLGSFSDISSRGREVSTGLGVGLTETAQSNWQVFGRLSAYATQFLIVMGLVSLIANRRKRNIDWEYFLVLLLGTSLLVMSILLPGFAKTLAMTRWYHIALLLIAPFLVLGSEQCISLLRRKNMIRNKQLAAILIVVVLIPYFWFQTNLVYEVAGVSSWSIPLSRYRMDKSRLYGWAGYIDEQSVHGAQWLARDAHLKELAHRAPQRAVLYTDYASVRVLVSYGRADQMTYWMNISGHPRGAGDLLYLSPLVVVYGIILNPYTLSYEWNSSELSPQLRFMNKIYSNGGPEIWWNTPIATTP